MHADMNAVHLAIWLLAGLFALPTTVAALVAPEGNATQREERARSPLTAQPEESRSERIYRVDKFVVPDSARDEFVDKVRTTHELLKAQPGFIQDFVLEQSSGPGKFNFVTIVEWKNTEAVDNARAAVKAMHKRMNFNPQEMMARLGIKADPANYRRIDAP